MESLIELWRNITSKVSAISTASPTTTSFVFGNSSLLRLTEKVACIIAHTDLKKDYMEEQYTDELKQAIRELLGYEVDIIVYSAEVTPPSLVEIEREMALAQGKEYPPPKPNTAPPEEEDYETGFFSSGGGTVTTAATFVRSNSAFTFENFVVGNSNKFAYTAATVVADNPSVKYNPLFIYGASGLGKTHLLYAITHRIAKNNMDSKILYVKGEEFTNQLIDSLSEKRSSSFRDKYRSADVFLVDDIQFIAGKQSTQEEFFHTFNALYESDKQIILTSDRPPKEINTLEDRLRSRFEWGLIVDIQPPDLELRIAILKRKAEAMKITVPNDVLLFLAENITSNIRQIEGAIKKLNAYSFIHGSVITLELAKNTLSDILSGTEPVGVTIEKIMDRVSKRYNISVDDIKGRKRTKEINQARQIAIYLIRNITDQSLPAIGRLFGRDHTTILSALNSIADDIAASKSFEAEITELLKSIRA
ncbi:MAG: chromosomal replication initiator protein DnaA [Eubacteriales bacterium]